MVCTRSIASMAKLTALSKPNVLLVPTMSLSIVFGTPTMGKTDARGTRRRSPASRRHRPRSAPRAPSFSNVSRHLRRVVAAARRRRPGRRRDCHGSSSRGSSPRSRWIPTTSFEGQLARPRRVDQPIKAVLEPDDRAVAADRGSDHGANHRVQTRGIAAAGEHADSSRGTKMSS